MIQPGFNKMLIKSIFLIIITLCTTPISFGTSCAIGNVNHTRIFKDMKDYYKNSMDFDLENGNFVGINTINPTSLYANMFMTNYSDNIILLDLSNKSISTIGRDSFLNLFCLHELNLSQNKIATLSEEMFSALSLLKVLNLSSNSIEELHRSPFVRLRRLQVLDLSSNLIDYLSTKSFYELDLLETLDLSKNKITTVYTETFSNVMSLVKLDLSFNSFEHVEAENWKNLGNLTTLNLSNNKLKYFEIDTHYSFVNLEKLYLEYNNLQTLNWYFLNRTFPKLTTFKIDHNNWECLDLNYIVMAFKDTKIDYSGQSFDKKNHRNGIGCNNVTYVSSTTEPVKFIELPSEKPYIFHPDHPVIMENARLNEKINSLKFGVVALTVLVICFVIFEIVTRCDTVTQRLRRIFRNDVRHSYLFDDSFSENIHLTRN